MDNTVGDVLHCEEQLKTTLQYDDKEKVLDVYNNMVWFFYI